MLQLYHFLFCKRSPTYSTLYGRFLQYIAPTISLILGVFVFGEHFTSTHMIAFFCIWVALFVFSVAKTKFLVQKQPKFIKINQQSIIMRSIFYAFFFILILYRISIIVSKELRTWKQFYIMIRLWQL